MIDMLLKDWTPIIQLRVYSASSNLIQNYCGLRPPLILTGNSYDQLSKFSNNFDPD